MVYKNHFMLGESICWEVVMVVAVELMCSGEWCSLKVEFRCTDDRQLAF